MTALLDTDKSFGEKSADGLLQYAIHNGIVSSGNAVDPMTEEECSVAIERLKEHYFNLEVSDYANIILKESVIDYSTAAGIYEDGDIVTMPIELGSAISEGTVFIIPGDDSGTAVWGGQPAGGPMDGSFAYSYKSSASSNFHGRRISR